MNTKDKAMEIIRRLYTVYPQPYIELTYTTPFELLIATILSAQCTDKIVNTVTPQLFANFPTPDVMARAPVETINALISRINFHNNKAAYIKAASEVLMSRFNGTIPDSMEDLLKIPGVARKTANVLLGSLYHQASGIVVDTHVTRLANKLGLTTSTNPVIIERDLMGLLPKDLWIDAGRMLTLHGRYVCIARPHTCMPCPLLDLCPEYTGKH